MGQDHNSDLAEKFVLEHPSIDSFGSGSGICSKFWCCFSSKFRFHFGFGSKWDLVLAALRGTQLLDWVQILVLAALRGTQLLAQGF
jgi:hypothetical protein